MPEGCGCQRAEHSGQGTAVRSVQSGYLAETKAALPSRVERTQELPAGATPLPSLVEIAQRNVALWDNIPRELVGLWAELLAAALEDMAKCGDELAW